MSYLWLTLRWHASYLTTKVHHEMVKKYHICDSVNNSKYDSRSASIKILERRHLLLPALNSADFTVWHCDKSIIPWGAEYCDFEKNSLSPSIAGSMKFMNTCRWCQGMFRWITANITLRVRHLSCHQWTFMKGKEWWAIQDVRRQWSVPESSAITFKNEISSTPVLQPFWLLCQPAFCIAAGCFIFSTRVRIEIWGSWQRHRIPLPAVKFQMYDMQSTMFHLWAFL